MYWRSKAANSDLLIWVWGLNLTLKYLKKGELREKTGDVTTFCCNKLYIINFCITL